jgi:hypothetical protein
MSRETHQNYRYWKEYGPNRFSLAGGARFASALNKILFFVIGL